MVAVRSSECAGLGRYVPVRSNPGCRDAGRATYSTAVSESRQSSTRQRARIWQKGFLSVLRESGNVRLACEAANIDRSTAYARRHADAEFAVAWNDAMEEAADLLEAEAWRRAYDGWEEPVYGRVGKDRDGQVGLVRKYSDSLMQTLLKGHKPEKYRERQNIEHTGKGGGPIEIDDARNQLATILSRDTPQRDAGPEAGGD